MGHPTSSVFVICIRNLEYSVTQLDHARYSIFCFIHDAIAGACIYVLLSVLKWLGGDTMSKNNYSQEAKFGWFAFLTYIGAAWYFLQISYGFWDSILALLKAGVWPAFLIHRAFELLSI